MRQNSTSVDSTTIVTLTANDTQPIRPQHLTEALQKTPARKDA